MQNLNVKFSAVCEGTADCCCDAHERARNTRRPRKFNLNVKFSVVCDGTANCKCDDHERAKLGQK